MQAQMRTYIFKRLLLMIPTLLGVLTLTFAVVQFVPGGPVEQMVLELKGKGDAAVGGSESSGAGATFSVCLLPGCFFAFSVACVSFSALLLVEFRILPKCLFIYISLFLIPFFIILLMAYKFNFGSCATNVFVCICLCITLDK